MMIVERDIGRLGQYTFDMGGAGDLLSLSLTCRRGKTCMSSRRKNCG